jgi:hypothetical protein
VKIKIVVMIDGVASAANSRQLECRPCEYYLPRDGSRRSQAFNGSHAIPTQIRQNIDHNFEHNFEHISEKIVVKDPS